MEGSFTIKNPRQDITPAIAGCWYRVPLTPRLPGDLSIPCFPCFVNLPDVISSVADNCRISSARNCALAAQLVVSKAKQTGIRPFAVGKLQMGRIL